MKKYFWMLFILSLVVILASCAPKKTIKPTSKTPTETRESEVGLPPAGEDFEVQEFPPELSARDKKFGQGTITIMLDDVHFEFDKYTLTNEAREILAKNAQILKNNPKIVIQIEGHCDERGTIEYNLALGQRRATSVRNYLIALGVDPGRIFTISYGKERPLDFGHDEEAWAKNRRAHPVPASE